MAEQGDWYYAQNGQSYGPMTLETLRQKLPSIAAERTLVFGPDTSDWIEARHVPALSLGRAATPVPAVPTGRRSDEIDYEIFGAEMQYVEITLDPGEMVIAEAGVMMFMTPGIQMETVFGDPSATEGGFWSKVAAAGKRALTGESLFMTTFRNAAPQGREVVAFAAPFPGKIVPMHLEQMGGELICQRDSFVCAARGIHIGIAFQKRFGVGIFGGEGFIMQRLTGDGIALVHAGGTIMRRTLAPGETLRLDTGCLVALMPSVRYDIELVGGIKNTLFGGEGLFLATLTGPGDVWCQSLPFSRLAGRIVAAAPQTGRGGREEGSILGGLGRLLDGDNR